VLTLTLSVLMVAVEAQAGGFADEKKDDPKAKDVKIYGRVSMEIFQKSVAIKSGNQLNLLTPTNATSEQITADFASRLKVDSIDWKKQMLVVIYGGEQPTSGYSVEMKSLEVKDGKLMVLWKLIPPAPDAIVAQSTTHPNLVILVDRFDGDIVFDPPPAKK
jgi:hypothetical protein